MRSKQERLYRLLIQGGRIGHQGQEYAMAESGKLVVIMHDQEGKERHVGVDCDMAAFYSMADNIDSDSLFLALG
jgi:hypothetical protein